MSERWLVFGGWALTPNILRPIFGDDVCYIDINPIMPCLMDSGRLADNWPRRFFDAIAPPVTPDHTCHVAGWSTGALCAYGLIQFLKPQSLFLLSPTAAFCQKEDFQMGTPVSIVQSMRTALLQEPDKVLRKFFIRCGIDTRHAINTRKRYTIEELGAGLLFLEHISFLPLSPITIPCSCLHGNNDKIIPAEAGRLFSDGIRGTFHRFDSGHAFFTEYVSDIAKLVDINTAMTNGT